MSRLKREPLNKPDERSSASTWTPLAVLIGITVAVVGLVVVLKVVA